MLRPSYSWFDHPNDISYKALIIKLFITQHYPSSCSFSACLLTPCSRVLLEKLTGSQLVKKFPAFYGTRRFITAITSVRHQSLTWATFLAASIILGILLSNGRGTTRTNLSLNVCVKYADCSSAFPHSTKSNARNRLLLLWHTQGVIPPGSKLDRRGT